MQAAWGRPVRSARACSCAPAHVVRARARGVCLSQPLPGDDPKQRKPDITKARKFLKWEPKIPLEQGIVKAAEYFKSLDLSRFKKPTKHDAHKNTDELEQSKKRQKTK